MISLVYQKRCAAMQLGAEIAVATGRPVQVSASFGTTYVVSYVSLNQAQKDAITAVVAAHVPDNDCVEEAVALP